VYLEETGEWKRANDAVYQRQRERERKRERAREDEWKRGSSTI